MPQLVAIAIIGRHSIPLFVETYGDVSEETELWLQCTMVSSLDPIEERVRTILSQDPKGAGFDNKYLGAVMPAGEYHVHAATSNTLVKLLAITRGTARDMELKNLLRTLHDMYTDQVCNPFYELETPITSATFRQRVGKLVNDTQLKQP
ncbi:Trafficking protein particle complex subunit 2-like protein [Diplonema papillatum]|nr:Trafficking protein particle complex subunit 2-like protein [Diplonema papillatum]